MFTDLLSRFAASCPGGDFFGLPKWYKYLPGQTDPNTGLCSPQLGSLNDVWLIVAAIVELLLRLAALVALGFVVWGGIQYLMSQGEPDKTTKARHTIINALVGLGVAVLSTAIIGYVAGKIK
jgi:ABC-type Fe3+ transport system permease subunit